ncbi:APC family permease [Adhaeribacter radiodurans]|uniref:Amino acid permease n=1 Tax=Adhaeribacter radiodurans TaxID=2745197 RepID=A0A7L7LDY4_9BACT|nr:amino acid permease [Adhaeribacter radiodurans]QMU30629.1 amino acid permease [Adhaeribacter radiodurans]
MQHTTASSFPTKEGLKREIGLWGLTANIINVVIGSGIFVLPAIVSQGLGATGILAYLFCGFHITIIMLCFAEVGSKVTLTGGAYAYIEAAFGKYLGFLTTNLFIFGASLMATAAVANALADTLSYLLPVFEDQLFRAGFFIVLFAGLTLVNVMGVKQGINLVKLTTIAKLTPLLLLVLWGSTQIAVQNLKWEKVPSLSDFGSVSLILFFAFQGAENSLSVSGEVHHPRKTIPKAILLSLLVILLLYIAVQVVAQGILGDSFPDYKAAPLAEVAQRIMGPFGVTLMIIGASISMFGYLSGDILNMPRVLFRSAKDGVIPIRALALIHPKFATPYVSVIAFTTLGCVLAITGEFKQLAILSSSSVLLIYLGVALAVIKLRIKQKADAASFRIPGGYTVPLLAVVTILVFLSNLTQSEMIGMLITLVVLSILFYLLKYLQTHRFKIGS